MARSRAAKKWSALQADLQIARRRARHWSARAFAVVHVGPAIFLGMRVQRYARAMKAYERALRRVERFIASPTFAEIAGHRKWYK
jgi:hypothetical protein